MKKTDRYTWLFLILVLIVPFTVYFLVSRYENRFSKLPVLGPVTEVNGIKTEHRIPAFEFVNQQGETVSDKDWDNKIVIANFFFTTCPVICPKMTNSLKRVQQANLNDKDILISSFTVDPERDSVARLKQYAAKFQINNQNWHLLTGDKKELYRLARKGFFIVAADGDGGPHDFIHSESLVLIDKQKRIRGYYSGTEEKPVNDLIEHIKKLQNEH